MLDCVVVAGYNDWRESSICLNPVGPVLANPMGGGPREFPADIGSSFVRESGDHEEYNRVFELVPFRRIIMSAYEEEELLHNVFHRRATLAIPVREEFEISTVCMRQRNRLPEGVSCVAS